MLRHGDLRPRRDEGQRGRYNPGLRLGLYRDNGKIEFIILGLYSYHC